MEYLSSSRKRPSINNASSTDDHDNGNKRSRLFDLTSSSPELPSLQQSQTFESTSTTSSTHDHTHEYYSAISSARHRLTSARIAHTHAVSTLHSAQLEYERTLNELDCAEVYVAGVEERWGVIDLESEEEESGVLNGGEMRRQKRKQQQQMHVQQVDIEELSQQQQLDVTTSPLQVIEITSSGETLVNGVYNLTPTTTSTTPTARASSTAKCAQHNIYAHSSGPFYIHQHHYDICIFPKVYGDKFRWCIGLVPCSSIGTSDDDDGASSSGEQPEQTQQVEQERQRIRDFDLAFIYYWTLDIPLHSLHNDTTTDSLKEGQSSLSSLQWGACHGVRPLPSFSVGGKRRRWWQFWRS